jgi:hypothetical protein
VLTILGQRRASGLPCFPQKSILSPRTNIKPGMRRQDICRSDWISLENRFPAPA